MPTRPDTPSDNAPAEQLGFDLGDCSPTPTEEPPPQQQDTTPRIEDLPRQRPKKERHREQLAFSWNNGQVTVQRGHGSAVSLKALIFALLSIPVFSAMARAMPDSRDPKFDENGKNIGGELSVFPPDITLLTISIADHFSSGVTQTVLELQDRELWNFVCDQLQRSWLGRIRDFDFSGRARIQHEIAALRCAVLTRSVIEGYLRRHMTVELAEELAVIHSVHAVQLALELGNFSKTTPDYLSPDVTDLVVADVVVLLKASRAHPGQVVNEHGEIIDGFVNSQSTDPRRARVIDGAKEHTTGDDRKKDGRRYQAHDALLSDRSTLTLAVRYVADGGPSEPVMAVATTVWLRQLVGPGLGHLVHDGAVQGTALLELARNAILGVTRPGGSKTDKHAQIFGEPDPHKKKRKGQRLGFFAPHPNTAGELCQHYLDVWDSRFYDTGTTKAKRPVDVTHIEFRDDPDNPGFDFELTITCTQAPGGAFTTVVPFDLTRGRNVVAQVLRGIATDTDEYARIAGHRQAAEAFFAWLQRTLRNGRSRHDDLADEYFDVVTSAMRNYALVWLAHVHLADTADE